MNLYETFSDTLASSITDLEKRVNKLLLPHIVSDDNKISSGDVTEWSLQGESAVMVSSDVVISGTSVEYTFVGFTGLFNSITYTLRYYQTVPRLYSDAQVLAGTDYITLGTGTFTTSDYDAPATYTFTHSVDISPIIIGSSGTLVFTGTTVDAPPTQGYHGSMRLAYAGFIR